MISILIVAVLSGFLWSLILRGPYWLYKRYKGEHARFWWPWGVVIGATLAVLTAGTQAAA